jgi:hypothetical protein
VIHEHALSIQRAPDGRERVGSMPEVEVLELDEQLVVRLLSDAGSVEEASVLVADVSDLVQDSSARVVSVESAPQAELSDVGQYIVRAVEILVELQGGRLKRRSP